MSSSIWSSDFDLQALNERYAADINGRLGIELTGYGPDWLEGTMPVDARTHQLMGILHGGASVVLAETLASAAANQCVDQTQFICVGQDVNASHLRSVSEGIVTGVARPLKLGRTSQVWGIEVRDSQERLTCVARLTVAVVKQRQ